MTGADSKQNVNSGNFMAIIVDRPPNYAAILSFFPKASEPGVIFAYGQDIYNPSGNALPPALLAHEWIHQQRQLSSSPEMWWDRYLSNPEFRYHEELFAHVAEYKAQLPGLGRNERTKLLMATAARLVAPLYNYQPPRSMLQAQRDIWSQL